MQDTAKLINILHTGFTISMALTIAFFLITVLLFFVFNIRQVFMIRSGKAAKRDIKKLEEENFKTGRLTNNPAGQRFNTASLTGGLSGAFESQEFPKTAQMTTAMPGEMPAMPPIPQYATAEETGTSVLGQNDTTVLNGENTTVLNAGATTVLNGGMQPFNPGQDRMFHILKKEVHIHTDEII